MKKKLNCWEFMKCGKGPDTAGSNGHDICSVASAVIADGLNGGDNGGRICWVIAENYFKGSIHCSEKRIIHSCYACEFRYLVTMDEGLLNICKTTGFLLENAEKVSS